MIGRPARCRCAQSAARPAPFALRTCTLRRDQRDRKPSSSLMARAHGPRSSGALERGRPPALLRLGPVVFVGEGLQPGARVRRGSGRLSTRSCASSQRPASLYDSVTSLGPGARRVVVVAAPHHEPHRRARREVEVVALALVAEQRRAGKPGIQELRWTCRRRAARAARRRSRLRRAAPRPSRKRQASQRLGAVSRSITTATSMDGRSIPGGCGEPASGGLGDRDGRELRRRSPSPSRAIFTATWRATVL